MSLRLRQTRTVDTDMIELIKIDRAVQIVPQTKKQDNTRFLAPPTVLDYLHAHIHKQDTEVGQKTLAERV